MLSNNFINILSQEKFGKYEYGFITDAILKKYVFGFNQYIYVCSPPSMIKAVKNQRANLNISSAAIIKEK